MSVNSLDSFQVKCQRKINSWSFIRIEGRVFISDLLTCSLFNQIKSRKLDIIWVVKGYITQSESYFLSSVLICLFVARGFYIAGQCTGERSSWVSSAFLSYNRRRALLKGEVGKESQHGALRTFVLRKITFRHFRIWKWSPLGLPESLRESLCTLLPQWEDLSLKNINEKYCLPYQ